MVYRWSFFLFLFIPVEISAVTYAIAEIFYRHTCHEPGLSTQVLNFENLTYLFHRVQKTAKKCLFHVFFTGRPHDFDRCAKTVCARRNAKTNVSSTMNYLSSDTTMITVVLVVLQINA